MARGFPPDLEPRPALRPPVPGDHCHRHQQPLATCRLRVDAWRLAGFRHTRRRRTVLRPRAATRGGQRPAVGRQHDRRYAVAPTSSIGPSPGASRGPGVSQHPAGSASLDHADIDRHDGQDSAERILETGRRRSRTRAGRQPGRHGRLSVFPGRESADGDQPERADLRGRGHQQRLPAGGHLHEQQSVSRRRRFRTTTGCT